MAEARIDIVVNDSSLDSLEAQLSDLQREIKKVGVGSKEFKQLATQIQGVEAQIQKANKAIQGFDIGAAVGNASKVLGGLAAGIAGISVLFGDSEDSAEKAAEAQQALAAAFGLVQLAEAVATIATLSNTAALVDNTIASEAALAASLKRQALVTTEAGAEQVLVAALTEAGIAYTLATERAANYDIVIGTTQLELKSLNGQIVATNIATGEQALVYDAATGSIISYNSALLGASEANVAAAAATKTATKAATGFGKSLLALATNPITLVIAGLAALYFIIQDIQEEFSNVGNVVRFGDGIEGISDAVNSVSGSFSSVTEKVLAYNELLRLGTLNADELAKAQEIVSAALLDAGASQSQVNNLLASGGFILEEYIKLLPQLAEQQVLFELLKEQIKEFTRIQLDSTQTAADGWQTTWNLIINGGYNANFALDQALTGLDNFNAEAEKFQRNIDQLLEKLRAGAQASGDDDGGAFKRILFGGGGRSQPATLKKQIRDISDYIIKNQRYIEDILNAGLYDGYEERKKILDTEEQRRLQDAEKEYQKILDDETVSNKQKEQLTIQYEALVAAIRSDFAQQRLELSQEIVEEEYSKRIDAANRERDLLIANLDIEETDRRRALDKLDELEEFYINKRGQIRRKNDLDLAKERLDIATKNAEAITTIYDKEAERLEEDQKAVTKIVQDEINNLQARVDAGVGLSESQAARLQELQDELTRINQEYTAKSKDLAQERADAETDANNEIAESTVALRTTQAEQFAEYIDQLNELVTTGLDIAIQYYASRQELLAIQTEEDIATLDQRLANAQEAFAARSESLAANEVLSAKAKANAIAQLEEQRLAEEKRIAKEREQLEKKAAKQGLDLQAKQAKANLGIAIAQAIADGSIGIAQATASGVLNPAQLAFIPAIIASLASAIAAYAAQTASINAQLGSLGFAEGGLVTGPGTGTSDSISARLSNGEYVVNAQSTAANLPLLEALNSTSSSGGSDMTQVLNELRGEIKQLRQQPVKAYVVTSELDEANRTEDYIERRAQL